MISNFIKIRPVGAEFRADRQTDMTKLIVAFLQFDKASKTQCTRDNLIRAWITPNGYKCSFSFSFFLKLHYKCIISAL